MCGCGHEDQADKGEDGESMLSPEGPSATVKIYMSRGCHWPIKSGHCLRGDLYSPPTSPRHEPPVLPLATGVRCSRRAALPDPRSTCEQMAQDIIADAPGGRRPQCSEAVWNEDRES